MATTVVVDTKSDRPPHVTYQHGCREEEIIDAIRAVAPGWERDPLVPPELVGDRWTHVLRIKPGA